MKQKKFVSGEEAMAAIKKGSRVFIGSGCGEPQYLCECLVRQAEKLFDVEILQVLSTRAQGYTTEKLAKNFQMKTFFVAGRGAREAVWEGRAEYIPMYMSQVPRMFYEKHFPIDCALLQVSPPNPLGYMSLGVSVDVAKAAMAAADLTIVQVNPQMPVTLGNTFIHIDDVDALVEYDEPLLEAPGPVLTEKDRLVGGTIARLVEDGSTIHAGLGHLPSAALEALSGKKDLGVHTDMITDAYLDLIKTGVVTNRKKETKTNRTVASYCLGTKKLFDYVNLNPFVEFHPISYTNDQYRIGINETMVSIHEAMEVDLTGLVCASSQGNRVYSGVGSLVDFKRGASVSKKGKFIIAFHAASPDERESRILPMLRQGSGTMASQAAAHYFVTEFGSVNLQGKSLHDRAVALIEVAHPKFREDLFSRAKESGLLSHGDQIDLFKPVVYPQDLEKIFIFDDEELLYRPAKATDLRAIQEFFYGLNDRDIHYRFLRSMKAFPRREMAAMAGIDYHNKMTILVLKGEIGFEKVVAIGRYMAVDQGDMVEVDVAVAEEYRRKGVGRELMKYVFEIAEQKGFKGVMAYVAHDNPKTLKMIKTLGYKAAATLKMGVFEVEINFAEKTDTPQMEIIYPDSK